METKLIAALVGLGLLIGAYFYGRADGVAITERNWQAREAKINAEHAEKIAAAGKLARDAEGRHAAELAAVSADYQKKLKENRDAKDRAIADLRRTHQRLSIPAACPPPGGGGVPETRSASGGRDGEARAQLSQSAIDFLISLAAEADEVVLQLTACQAVVPRPTPPGAS